MTKTEERANNAFQKFPKEMGHIDLEYWYYNEDLDNILAKFMNKLTLSFKKSQQAFCDSLKELKEFGKAIINSTPEITEDGRFVCLFLSSDTDEALADLRVHEGWAPLFVPKFLHFHAVFRKNWSNSMLAPLWDWCIPSGKSWICHCEGNQNYNLKFLYF